MKIYRSTKCSLSNTNTKKLQTLTSILKEYGNVVNHFILMFWGSNLPSYAELLKPVVDTPNTWLSARLRKVAAREAITLIRANREQNGDNAILPWHSGHSMHVSSTIASLTPAKETTAFDCWLHLQSIGNKASLQLPIKLHKHYHKLASLGKRLESYIITKDYIRLCFEMDTGPKLPKDRCIGIDTGIKSLASLSTGEQFGTDIESCIDRIKRCKHGSKGQKRASRSLRQRMDEVAKEVTSKASLVVVENLKGITQHTKRRLVKSVRRSIGRWNVSYWLKRLQMTCENRNVSFRTVSPYKTSQTCSSCGHVDRRNRVLEKFLCLKCGYTDNADLNAAKNILTRFLTGKYGSGCKPLCKVCFA